MQTRFRLAFALMACFFFAAAPLHADQKINVRAGRLGQISTTLDGAKKLVWIVAEGDFDLIPDSAGRQAIVLCPRAGTYKAIVFGAKADEPLVEIVFITAVGDPGPGPGPGPDPKPPAPDDLSEKIGVAWQQEFDKDKAKQVKTLASVYRYGAESAESSTTWGQLFDRMNTQALAVGAYNKLTNIQVAVQHHLVANLPTDRKAAMSAADKDKARSTFSRISTILESLR